MPFVPSEENVLKVIRTLMAQGEEPIFHFNAGRRLFAVTSTRRFLNSNFPFFAHAKILAQAQLDQMGTVDFVHPKGGHFALVATGIDGGAPIQVPLQLGHVYDHLDDMVRRIHNEVPASRPPYLAPDEAILATIITDDGTVRATDRALYLLRLGKPGGVELVGRVGYDEMVAFDYYGVGMNSLAFTVVTRTEPKTFKIGRMALDRFALSSTKEDPEWFPKVVRERLDAMGVARPA